MQHSISHLVYLAIYAHRYAVKAKLVGCTLAEAEYRQDYADCMKQAREQKALQQKEAKQ